jgi:mono/diheme cytochrome c family protein
MNKRLVAVLIVAALMTMSVGAFAADAGADLYKAKCQGCHGADGTPSAMAAKMGAKSLDKAKSEKDFIDITTNGKNKMPAYKGKLTDDQIKTVATYMKGLAK